MIKNITLENLGYKKHENHPKEEIKENTFTTQDNPIIRYIQEDDKSIEQIIFDIWGKIVWLSGYRKDLKTHVPCPINMEELRAIYEVCEELGWLDE